LRLDDVLQTLECRSDVDKTRVVFRTQKIRRVVQRQAHFFDGRALDSVQIDVVQVQENIFGYRFLVIEQFEKNDYFVLAHVDETFSRKTPRQFIYATVHVDDFHVHQQVRL
jgi:hypothetical protein